MTTVTPSDRAGADSAQRSATIPTQRSGQALRLLILGTGKDATAFRERAAESGAELAQRFSVRVTHVVVEDGIGEDDARLVRARTAGLPVLDLAEGTRLLAEGAGGASAGVGIEAAGASDVGVEAGPGASAVIEGEAGTDVVAENEAAAGLSAAAEIVEAAVRDVPLIRPRSEFVPDAVEVGPADVFTGSALEAVLLFPPLAGDVTQADAEIGSGDSTESESEAESDAPRSALLEVASASCGCAGEEGAVMVDDQAEVEAAAATAAACSSSSSSADRLSGGTASSLAWALVPLVSLGLLTPVAMGYAAYRSRSRGLWIATAVYTLAVVAAFTVSAAAPLRTGSHAAVGDLLTACLAASWLGGTLHSLLIRRRVFG